MRILLIEDDELLREALGDFLIGKKYEVVASLDQTEVAQLIPTVDLVLSDYEMGLNFKEIKKQAKACKIPLILMSGSINAESQHSVFLAKPFNCDNLVKLIEDSF